MKYYYIKVDALVNGEWKPYGYFEELILTDYFQGKPEINISTISEKQYAKKYKKKAWAEKLIEKIIEETKDNVFVYCDDVYMYRYNIVEE